MDALTKIDPNVPVESKHAAVKLMNMINRSAEEMDMVKLEKDALLMYYKNMHTKLQECLSQQDNQALSSRLVKEVQEAAQACKKISQQFGRVVDVSIQQIKWDEVWVDMMWM